MDRVAPERLWIGGLKALDSPETLEEARITHILSVLEFDYCDYGEFGKYERLLIQVEDDPRESLLRHFSQTSSFIEQALSSGGSVFVHCAMGVSRSAAVTCAYLMSKRGLSSRKALEQVRQNRPSCQPNDGFMEQLEVYHRMLEAPNQVESNMIYSNWMQKQTRPAKM